MIQNFTEHQLGLIDMTGGQDSAREFEVGLNIQGSGVRVLTHGNAGTGEEDDDCQEQLAACNSNNASPEDRIDDLEDALDALADGGTILALEVQSYYSPPALYSWTAAHLVKCFSGATSNRIEFSRPVPPSPYYDTRDSDIPPIPGFAASGGPAMAFFDSGGNMIRGDWRFNDSLLMSALSMFIAGDTCTVKYYWFTGTAGQITVTTPITVFTCTATSPTTFTIVNNLGSYSLDNQGVQPKP